MIIVVCAAFESKAGDFPGATEIGKTIEQALLLKYPHVWTLQTGSDIPARQRWRALLPMNIRSGPSTMHPLASAPLTVGDVVIEIGQQDGWLHHEAGWSKLTNGDRVAFEKV